MYPKTTVAGVNRHALGSPSRVKLYLCCVPTHIVVSSMRMLCLASWQSSPDPIKHHACSPSGYFILFEGMGVNMGSSPLYVNKWVP